MHCVYKAGGWRLKAASGWFALLTPYNNLRKTYKENLLLTKYSIIKHCIVFSYKDFIKYNKYNQLIKVKEICLYKYINLSPLSYCLFVLITLVKPIKSFNSLLKLLIIKYFKK
jgi:hypothetical protein